MSVRDRLANIYRSLHTREPGDEVGQPADAAPGRAARAAEAADSQPVAGVAEMPTSRAPRARVMIVEDHALVRDAVRRALDADDIEIVAEASTAELALDAAAAARPDLILLDIDLPAASGLDAIVELRRRVPDARVVMLTISSDDEDVAAAVRLGATGFLTKDMSSATLLSSVRAALSGDLAMAPRMAQRLIERLGGSATGARPALVAELLTPRELEILRLMSEGMTAREIGDALVLSPRTVEGHVGKILRKLGVRNRVEAVQHYRHRPA